MNYHWNPLYPSNEEANPLEEAAREAEWEDNIRENDKKCQEKRRVLDTEDDDLSDLFL